MNWGQIIALSYFSITLLSRSDLDLFIVFGSGRRPMSDARRFQPVVYVQIHEKKIERVYRVGRINVQNGSDLS